MYQEIIQKLLKLGWEPREYHQPDEDDFYLRKEFEVSQAKELYSYTDYTPTDGEKIFIAYQLYPNRQIAEWCIWGENDNPGNVLWEEDDYDSVIELSLEDRLFTYPHWIEKIADKFGMNLNQLATRAGLDRSILYKMVERNTKLDNLTVGTLKALAKAIGIKIDDLIDLIEEEEIE